MIKEDVKLFLIATIINFFSESAEFRGPHHPHRHYIPQKDGVKLTQDKNLLHDAEYVVRMSAFNFCVEISKELNTFKDVHYVQCIVTKMT